ncbi:sunset domain-containing protein [Amycolatopsis panacis]|uniref:Uncharacterized protein n=1 Tax=Amycolatopsis panacis TaxID=2340917 RepID=A0A419I388_9PSEU|nr:hypothetical protein [Amycolatopsis panacis]RJQ84552.1 hypothetical protein D5S19_16515 [Amycolatopsis panacis]
MSIFGQVWLWSLLAFFVGVLVSWLVLLRPVRRRVRDLEDQLVKAHADAARTPVNAGATGTAVLPPAPAETPAWRPDEAAPTELLHQPVGRGFEPEAEYEAEYRTAPEPVTDDEVDEAFARADAEETGLLGLADYRAAEQTTVAGFAALDGAIAAEPGHARSEPGTVDAGFAGGSIVEPEEPGYLAEPDYLTSAADRVPAEQSGVDPDYLAAEQATVEPGFAEIAPEESTVDSDVVAGNGFSGFSSDEPVANGDAPVHEESTTDSRDQSDYHAAEYLVPEEESGSGYHRAPEPEPSVVEHQPSSAGVEPDEPVSLFQPAARPADPAPEPDWFGGGAAAERSPFEEPAPVGHLEESVPTDHLRPAEGGRGEPEPEPVDDGAPGLPKRRRRESPRGGFDAPRPIQPSMRPVERRDPELTGAHSGSLFEPAVRPNQVQQAAPPEPSPAHRGAVDAVPPGPFGPGSAMPRPGGGRPADGFSVKASVTALRYCTDESAQFPKMVAEVWFRTAADAERVGFRPLH